MMAGMLYGSRNGKSEKADLPEENNAEEQVLLSWMLLLALAARAAVSSEIPFPCILLAGLLMTVYTIRSLPEEPGGADRLDGCLSIVQVILSILFAMFSGGYLPYLVLCEYRISRRSMVRVVLPSFAYFIWWVVAQDAAFPLVVYRCLVLMGLGVLLCLAERLINAYFITKRKIARAVSTAAVNEMYEKKLNRELTIKNYLADRNARLEERENISRNIHNSAGHSITAAIMALEAADMLFDVDPERAKEKMNLANERVRGSLDTIRRAVRVLDRENEYVLMSDFLQELEAAADSFAMDTAVDIRMDCADVDRELLIPRAHMEFLTGAARELFSNGVRHGNARFFILSLSADSGHMRMQVADNGSSDFSGENQSERLREGFGLKKLISYAERCGGRAVFVNENGFRAEITLPFEGKENGDE